jgi:hypothetical protein
MDQKVVSLDVFLNTGMAELASSSPRIGIFHVGDQFFELRCSSGIVAFAGSGSRQELFDVACGRTRHKLPAILDALSAVGVRRLPLEWDGW